MCIDKFIFKNICFQRKVLLISKFYLIYKIKIKKYMEFH